MTARTADLQTDYKDGVIFEHPVATAETIYKGVPVFLTAGGGFLFSNDGATLTLANGDFFAGFADEQVVNAGADGAKLCRVRRKGVFLHTSILGTVTQAKVGDPVYVNNVSDDASVTLTSDMGQPQCTIGKLLKYVSATSGWVSIDDFTEVAAAAGA